MRTTARIPLASETTMWRSTGLAGQIMSPKADRARPHIWPKPGGGACGQGARLAHNRRGSLSGVGGAQVPAYMLR